MTPRRRRLTTAATTLAALGLTASPALADPAVGLLASGTKIVSFDTASPNQQSAPITVTGLAAGETIVGLDTRPANGVVYALGRNGTQGRLLTLDTATGAATLVGVLKDGSTGGADIVLDGNQFDLDFNPGADRLRIVSDLDQNLRVNPSNGVVAQLVMGMPGDGDLNPGDPDVGATAYSNSFAGTTSTTQYVINAADDTLTPMASPNGGTLGAGLPLGIGDVSNVGGLDIVPGAPAAGLATPPAMGTVTNRALALLTVGATTRMYSVDLTTGAATAASAAIGGADPLVDFTVTAQDTVTLVGLVTAASGAQSLIEFSSENPSVTTGTVALTGLPAGETLIGIDSRPRTGALYGVTNTGKVFVVDPDTGVATAPGNNQIVLPLAGTRYGFDFNPAADRLRIVSDAEQNLRINVDNAASGTAGNGSPDGALDAGDVVHAAYTNSVSDPAGTALLYVDHVLDQVQLTTNANSPAGNTAPFGTAAGANVAGDLQVDVTDRGGFDIVGPFNRRLGAFATTAAPDTFRLYTIGAEGALSSEAKAIPTGTIAVPAETQLDGIAALAGDTVSFGSASVSVGETGTAATVTVLREGELTSAATIGYTTFDGNATAGADYTATTGTVTFAPGETVKTVTVPILDDALVEGTETFGVALTSTTDGARIAQPSLSAVSILDDEVPASQGTGPGATVFVPFPVTVNVPGTAPTPAFAFVRAATDEIRLGTLRSKGFLLRVYCSTECKVSGNLTARGSLARRTGKNVARIRSTTVRAGQTRRIRVRLTTKARRALVRSTRATFKLPLTITPSGGKAQKPTALTVRAFR